MNTRKISLFLWSGLLTLFLSLNSVAAQPVGEHRGTIGTSKVRWESTFESERLGSRIDFVKPLPLDAEITDGYSEIVYDDEKQVIGLISKSQAISISSTSPLEFLEPPLIVGVPQRIVISGGGVRFDKPNEHFERRVGYMRHTMVSDQTNDRLKSLGKVNIDALVIHVHPKASDTIIVDAIVTTESKLPELRFWLFFGSGLILVGAIVFFKLKRMSMVEEADEFLREVSEWET